MCNDEKCEYRKKVKELEIQIEDLGMILQSMHDLDRDTQNKKVWLLREYNRKYLGQ